MTGSSEKGSDLERPQADVFAAEDGPAVPHRDKALDLLQHTDPVTDFDFTSPAALAVKRKIDRRVMPLLYLCYLLQLIDKNTLSYAAIMGIKKSTHLTPSDYSWLGSIVCKSACSTRRGIACNESCVDFGYLGGDLPAVWFMQKFPLRYYLGSACVLWGVSLALFARAAPR